MAMNLSDRVDRTNDLLDLLRDLADVTVDLKARSDEFVERLNRIYGKGSVGTYRHHYSEISSYLYDNYSDDIEACVTIYDALEDISRLIKDHTVARAVEKLMDHISLETLRMGQMQEALAQSDKMKEVTQRVSHTLQMIERLERRHAEIVKTQEKISSEQEAVSKSIGDEKNEIDKLVDNVKQHSVESVSILSIFAGVVFAFSGGFSILGNVFNTIGTIGEQNSYLFLACLVIMGLILFDVIHLLLWFVSKLVYKNDAQKYKVYIATNIGLLLCAAILLLFYYNVIPEQIVKWFAK